MSNIVNALMTSSSWKDSVFFLSYDEGGGPYDHVPPVPGHSNDFTNPSLGTIPDISQIAVNPDSLYPVRAKPDGIADLHCDLLPTDPGANPADAAAVQGFAAQLGFRVAEHRDLALHQEALCFAHSDGPHSDYQVCRSRFIGPSAHLTARDAAQPNLLDFFDFNDAPWATPPTPPSPVIAATLGYDPCRPTDLGAGGAGF